VIVGVGAVTGTVTSTVFTDDPTGPVAVCLIV